MASELSSYPSASCCGGDCEPTSFDDLPSDRVCEALFTHVHGFLSPEMSARLFEAGLKGIPFDGAYHCSCSTTYPRAVFNFEDVDQVRRLSDDFSAVIDMVTAEISRRLGSSYQCIQIWANHYRTHSDFTPEHQDSAPGQVIACLSLGGERILTTRPLPGIEGSLREWMIRSGDLYFFNSVFNLTHLHGVPRMSGTLPEASSRISLILFLKNTFTEGIEEEFEEDVADLMGL